MTDVMAPGRLYHPDDHVVMVVDIEDCPVADVPLTEIYDSHRKFGSDRRLPLCVENIHCPANRRYHLVGQSVHYSTIRCLVLRPSIERLMVRYNLLSELHKHKCGTPALTLPDTIDDCTVCMASKLRKTPRDHTDTMTATKCLQGLGIGFAFMVQKSTDSKRFDNLIGHNGETCYVLITNHTGRLIGHAFATIAHPVDWLNQWLANNAPACTGKYVRMDSGGEVGRCHKILDTFANFGYQTQLTSPDSSRQNGPGERPHQTIGDAWRAMLTGADLRSAFRPRAFYHFVRLYNFIPPRVPRVRSP